MLKRYSNKITAFLLSFSLILSSVGIPVYKHYCQGKLIGFQYLVAQDNFCTDESEEKACCNSAHEDHHEEKNCCNHTSDDLSCNSEKDCKNCCEDEMELVRIDLLTTIQSERNFNITYPSPDLQLIHHLPVLIFHSSDIEYVADRINTRSGPLPDGKSRIISYQKFIC